MERKCCLVHLKRHRGRGEKGEKKGGGGRRREKGVKEKKIKGGGRGRGAYRSNPRQTNPLFPGVSSFSGPLPAAVVKFTPPLLLPSFFLNM